MLAASSSRARWAEGSTTLKASHSMGLAGGQTIKALLCSLFTCCSIWREPWPHNTGLNCPPPSLIRTGVWSPAGGFFADPKHWKRNTALAFV